MKQDNSLFGTAQEILYTVCFAAWNLCQQYLKDFAGLKSLYTKKFIADAVQAVQAAKDLPNVHQSVAARKAARIDLGNATTQVRDNWQLLKVYITKAYTKDMLQTKLNLAGASYYAKTTVNNWSSVRSLIDAANSFISDNMEVLMANQNMPADFQATFQSDGDTCTQLSTIFFSLNLAKKMATDAKTAANNAIYQSLMEMLKDGQQIFKADAAVKQLFVFRNLVASHKGEGTASLSGRMYNASKQPVEGAVIVSKDQKYTATTNEKGHYRIARIASGTYTFSITCPGYNPLEQTITFTAGIASRASFDLQNIMKKVA